MLEPYKNVDGLADAWRESSGGCPRRGCRGRQGLAAGGDRPAPADLPGHVEWLPELAPPRSRQRSTGARLVLPSWSEGLGRVVIEAFARGRGVVAAERAGSPTSYARGRGPPRCTRREDELVAGLRSVLEDDARVARLGAAAHASYGAWHQTADDFAQAYRELVERVLGGAR